MQHRNPRPFATDLGRAKMLIEARQSPDDVAVALETEIALKVIGPDILARDLRCRELAHPSTRDLSAFEATEVLARELRRSVTSFASHNGTKAPASTKYDLRFATRVTFNELWQGRQVIDELGVPTPFYVDTAVAYWTSQGKKRIPRVSQLFSPDVIAHVMKVWARQSARHADRMSLS